MAKVRLLGLGSGKWLGQGLAWAVARVWPRQWPGFGPGSGQGLAQAVARVWSRQWLRFGAGSS